jgi:glycerol-3-phosphate dehydrogenase
MEADVTVIGGGATGTGVAWDLSLRGLAVVLVDKGDLSSGTSGRYHGLLHSGARYVMSDPDTARECMTENTSVRRIVPRAVEDTGGLFVLLPGDDPSFADQWTAACRSAGITLQELSPSAALRQEPLLNPDVRRAFQVPDAVCNSMILCAALAAASREKGARILPFHRVDAFVRRGDGIQGVRVIDARNGEAHEIRSRFIVNATGPWAGHVAALAGISLSLDLSRGALVAYKGRLVRSAVQRLRLPDDADAILPRGQVSIAGTTEVPTTDPSDRRVEPWEPRLIQERIALLVPGISGARVAHSWSAVRPLYDPRGRSQGADPRLWSRNFTVIHHSDVDGDTGLVTVVGGKLSTFRLMAEKTADLVCRELRIDIPSRTSHTALP